MLERTAAGLESCSLQRVVAKPAKRCRQLHTAFWQHGASAIDLSSVWPGLPRERELEAAEDPSAPRPLQSGLIASAFLLDFLYPTATLPLLRRIYPSLPRTQDGQQKSVVSRKRAFSSRAEAVMIEASSSPELFHHTMIRDPDERLFRDPSTTAEVGYSNTDSYSSARDYDSVATASSISESQTAAGPTTRMDDARRLTLLRGHLSDSKGRHFREVWNLYFDLDHEHRATVRIEVLQYLTRSSGFVEAERAASIFRRIPIAEWNDEALLSGITLALRVGDVMKAVDLFKTGLKLRGLSGGLEPILVKTMEVRDWTAALNAWTSYYAAELEKQPDSENLSNRLGIFRSVSRLGSRFAGFKRYLTSHEYLENVRKNPMFLPASQAFEKHLARMALHEPCTPDHATIILDSWKDANLYDTYFTQLFARWADNAIPHSEIAKVLKMYQGFRALPDARPSREVLQGLFKIYYPKDLAGLEQVYQDWIRFHGSLNQWAYEQFLKLAAHKGDIQTVRRLWEKYTTEYPEMLKNKRGFRSLLNVYSQVGDAAAVQRQLDEMSGKYGLKLDISCWNVLLKAHMRANDYDGVLACFEEICQQSKPDSFTFAHAMAMSSKKGDLDDTLNFFQKAQQAKVPVTKEMALAVVVAYGQNRLLAEAETLCSELALRNLVNTATWNQVINFYGIEGKLSKCEEVMQTMRTRGYEPDAESYGFLLQAYVKKGHVTKAFNLLKQARSRRLFAVTPDHFAVVLAGAARTGNQKVISSVQKVLRESNMPTTFDATVALLNFAVKWKPADEKTKLLSRELVTKFREALAASRDKNTERSVAEGSLGVASQNSKDLKDGYQEMGRAVMLLVELRDFASLEELMNSYLELFPQFKGNDDFPPNVVSALMVAYFNDTRYDKVLELWGKLWRRVSESSARRRGQGIYVKHEFDVSRAVNVVIRTYTKQGDTRGLINCVSEVTAAGFKLTRPNWFLFFTSLEKLGQWDAAMIWCERIFMPTWRGWSYKRLKDRERWSTQPGPFRRFKTPADLRMLVESLQRHWLRMRSMVAWSVDVAQRVEMIKRQCPHLVAAFETQKFEQRSSDRYVNAGEMEMEHIPSPTKDIDKILKTASYGDLLKLREALKKQLMDERKREKVLGLARAKTSRVKTKEEREAWKLALQGKVERYALKWAQRREAAYENPSDVPVEDSSDDMNTRPHVSSNDGVEERKRFWADVWQRYDQKPHNNSKPKTPQTAKIPTENGQEKTAL